MSWNARAAAVSVALFGTLLLSHHAAAQSCGEVETPACDGACLETEACVPADAGCECIPTTIPCGFLNAGGGPACHGYCPSLFSICSDMMVGGELDCVCIPAFTPTATMTATFTATVTPTLTSTPEPTDTPRPTDTPAPTASSTSTMASLTPTPIACVGDCNNDGRVTVDELVRAVNIALGNSFISTCREVDPSGDGQVTVNEILQAVNRALNGC